VWLPGAASLTACRAGGADKVRACHPMFSACIMALRTDMRRQDDAQTLYHTVGDRI